MAGEVNNNPVPKSIEITPTPKTAPEKDSNKARLTEINRKLKTIELDRHILDDLLKAGFKKDNGDFFLRLKKKLKLSQKKIILEFEKRTIEDRIKWEEYIMKGL